MTTITPKSKADFQVGIIGANDTTFRSVTHVCIDRKSLIGWHGHISSVCSMTHLENIRLVYSRANTFFLIPGCRPQSQRTLTFGHCNLQRVTCELAARHKNGLPNCFQLVTSWYNSTTTQSWCGRKKVQWKYRKISNKTGKNNLRFSNLCYRWSRLSGKIYF